VAVAERQATHLLANSGTVTACDWGRRARAKIEDKHKNDFIFINILESLD
jgi:hypothetical protein